MPFYAPYENLLIQPWLHPVVYQGCVVISRRSSIRMKTLPFLPQGTARRLATLIGLVALWTAPGLSAAEIHDAAESGDVPALEKLIEADASLVNLKDKGGDLPLHHAVQKGQTKAVTLLLDKGADVNAKGFDDWTPLHWAAKIGSKALCKLLLDKGADHKVLNGVHRTPYQMATGSAVFLLRDLEPPPPAPVAAAVPMPPAAAPERPAPPAPAPEPSASSSVMVKKADPEPTTTKAMPSSVAQFATREKEAELLKAVQADDSAVVETLLAGGADANAHDADGFYALHLAVKAGKPGAAAALLKKGAKVDVLSKVGNTPLITAAIAGDAVCVEMLIKAGASVTAKNKGGMTALMNAAAYGRTAAAKMLVEAGADLTLTGTTFRLTPLHFVASCGAGLKGVSVIPAPGGDADYLAIAGMLLDHKADAKAASGKGTPLMIAARSGSAEMVALLLDHGADIEGVWTTPGFTPLIGAASTGHVPVIELLLKRGARTDAHTDQGATALHIAAQSNQPEAIKALVKAGIDVDVRDRSNATPLIIAAATGQLEAVKTLIDQGAKTDAVANQGITALKASRQHNQEEVLRFLIDREAGR